MASNILLQGFDAQGVNIPQQQAAQISRPSQGFLGKVGGFAKSAALSFVHPLTDVAHGIATDIAANSSNKSVRDYAIQQQKDFTLKRAAGDELGLASMLVPGAKGVSVAAKAGGKFLPRLAVNAGSGAGFNASAAMSDNQSNGDILKAAGVGAATGGVLTGVGSLLSRARPQIVTHQGTTELTPHPVAPPVAPPVAAPSGYPSYSDPVALAKARATYIPQAAPAAPAAPMAPAAPALPIVHAADLPKPSIAEAKFNPLESASDEDLMVRNHIANLQFRQGEGAQLPSATALSPEAKAGLLARVRGMAGASPPPTVAPASESVGAADNGIPLQWMSSPESRNAVAPDKISAKDVAKSVLTPNAPPDLSSGNNPAVAAPVAAGKGNLLQRIGGGLKKPAIGATSPASPFGATKEADISGFLKKEGLVKPGSNSQTIYEALPKKFEEYQSQVKALLAKDTSTVDPAGLAAKVEQAIGDTNHIAGSDAASETVKANVKKLIQKAATDNNGYLTTADLYSLKSDIQGELTRAYDKVAKGGVLTGSEDAMLAARNAINDFMPPEVKAIGQKQSMLFDAATGLNKARNEKARIPALAGLILPKKPSKALSRGIQSVGTLVGSPIEGVGNLAAKAGDIVGPIAGKAAAVGADVLNTPLTSAVAAPGVSDYLSQQAQDLGPSQPAPMDNTAQPASSFQPGAQLQINPATGQLEALPQESQQQDNGLGGITSQDIENAMLQDLAQNGGANLAHLNTIYSIVQKREAQAAAAQKQQKIPAAQANAMQTAQTAVQGLQDIQAAFNNTTGTGKGILSKIAGRTPLVGNNVAAVNNAIRVALPSIAKSLGYGTTSADLQALLAQLPSTSDTQKSAAVKLSLFQQKIEQQLQQNLAIQGASQPDSTSSSLSQGATPDFSAVGATL